MGTGSTPGLGSGHEMHETSRCCKDSGHLTPRLNYDVQFDSRCGTAEVDRRKDPTDIQVGVIIGSRCVQHDSKVAYSNAW